MAATGRWRAFGLTAALGLALCAGCPQELVTCHSSEECPASQVCVENVCRVVCNSDTDCSSDEICYQGACVPPRDRDRSDAARGDRVQADAPGGDALVPDAPIHDAAAADTRLIDTAAPDLQAADRAGPDAAARDAGPRDSAVADASHADAGPADARPVDSSARDSAGSDAIGLEAGLTDAMVIQVDGAQGDAVAVDACAVAASPPWWNGGYDYRFRIEIDQAPAGYTVELRLTNPDASTVFIRSALDGADLRVVRHAESASEIDRDLVALSGDSVVVRFRIQEPQGYDGSCSAYYIYVGNDQAPAPLEELRSVYLLFEDFEGFSLGDNGTPTFVPRDVGRWSVVDTGGNKAYRASFGSRATAEIADLGLTNAAIEVLAMFPQPGGDNNAGIVFHASNLVPADMDSSCGSLCKLDNQAALGSWTNGNWNGFHAWFNMVVTRDIWYRLAVRFVDPQIELWVDGESVVEDAEDPNPGDDRLGLYAFEAAVQFDDVKVWPLADPEPRLSLGAAETVAP